MGSCPTEEGTGFPAKQAVEFLGLLRQVDFNL